MDAVLVIQILLFMAMMPAFGYLCVRAWGTAWFETKLRYQTKFFGNFDHK